MTRSYRPGASVTSAKPGSNPKRLTFVRSPKLKRKVIEAGLKVQEELEQESRANNARLNKIQPWNIVVR